METILEFQKTKEITASTKFFELKIFKLSTFECLIETIFYVIRSTYLNLSN